jgi:tetratricopeptide (TPR) repeat protein
MPHALWIRPPAYDLSGVVDRDRRDLGSVQLHLADLLIQTRRHREAEVMFRESIDHGERLLTDFPNTQKYLGGLVFAYDKLGNFLSDCGRTDEAIDAKRQCLRLALEVPSRFPEAADLGSDPAWAHYELGVVLHKAGRRHEAAEQFRTAIPLFEKRAARSPDNPRFTKDLASVLLECPDAEFRDIKRAASFAQKSVLLGFGRSATTTRAAGTRASRP